MLVLEVRFLTGRYHATPWGRHVNEGAAEWPPSPWRLLRALISSWQRTARDLPEETMLELLRALAEPPHFRLPRTSSGHFRHYVPAHEGVRLMIDAFTVVEEPMAFVWPDVHLEAPVDQALDRLLPGLSYLGRAESWTEVTRVEAPRDACFHALPLEGDSECWDLVTLLGATSEVTVDGVVESTLGLKKTGASRPSGSRWLTYEVSEVGRVVRASATQPTLALFLLREEVPRTDILTLADRVRRGLFSLGKATPTLLGKVEGKARDDGHQHLHILPEGPPHGETLTRVWLWALEGFGPEELARLRGLAHLPRQGRHLGVRLVLYEVSDGARGDAFGVSDVWRSYTPHLLGRHPKSDGRDGAEEQIFRECALRGLPVPDITRVEAQDRVYGLNRGPRRRPPGTPGYFRLRFSEKVTGPLSLGHSAHFGMGRFVPE